MPTVMLAKRLRPSTMENERMYSRINTNTCFSIRESLRTNIIHLYGKETSHPTKHFEELRRKKCLLLCDLIFLIRCRDNNVQPTFTKLSYHTKTRRTAAILKRASNALLKDEIHRTRLHLS